MTELVAGRYRLLDEAGRGAMGVVWRARDEQLDRVVAVKQLAHENADPAATARAGREARLSARLRHAHVVTVHDVVDHDGRPYLIMEYVQSRSLADLLREHTTLPAEQVAAIGRELASALVAAHAAGIVHRDVTPSNVLVTTSGTAKIADFGISHATGESVVTGGGLIAGTPAYLAPEVAAGNEAGFAADVFSLGATLYHALEGTPPFGTDDNPYALLARVTHDQIAPPGHTGPLADVLMRMLDRDAARRPTMAGTEELLAAVVDNRPIPPATRLLQVPRVRRRVAVPVVIGAVLLILGVVIGFAIAPHGTPVAGPTARPPAAQPPAVVTDKGCTARYQVTTAWPGGYQVQVTVHNTRSTALKGWQVTWRLPNGHHVDGLWNGLWNMRGTTVTVDNANWNAQIAMFASTTFGLNVAAPGTVDPAQSPAVTCNAVND